MADSPSEQPQSQANNGDDQQQHQQQNHDSEQSITMELLEDEDSQKKSQQPPSTKRIIRPQATKSMSPTQTRRTITTSRLKRPIHRSGTSPIRLPPKKNPDKTTGGDDDRRDRMMTMAREFRSETSLFGKLKHNLMASKSEEDAEDSSEELVLRSSATHFFVQTVSSSSSHSRSHSQHSSTSTSMKKGSSLVIPPFRQRAASMADGSTSTTSSHRKSALPPRQASSSRHRAPLKRSNSNLSEYFEARKAMMMQEQINDDDDDSDDDAVIAPFSSSSSKKQHHHHHQAIPTHALHEGTPRKPKRSHSAKRERQHDKHKEIEDSQQQQQQQQQPKLSSLSSSRADASKGKSKSKSKSSTTHRSIQDRMYPQSKRDSRGTAFYKEGLKSLSHLDHSSSNNNHHNHNHNNHNASKGSNGSSFNLHMSLEDVNQKSKSKSTSSQSKKASSDALEEEDSLHLSQEDLAPKSPPASPTKATTGKEKASFYKQGLRSLQLSPKHLPKSSSSPIRKAGNVVMSAVSRTNLGRFLQKEKTTTTKADQIKAKAEKNSGRKTPGRSQSLSEKLVRSGTPRRKASSGSSRASSGASTTTSDQSSRRIPPKRTRSGVGQLIHKSSSGTASADATTSSSTRSTRTQRRLPRRCNTAPPAVTMARLSSSFSKFEDIKQRKPPKRSMSSAAAYHGGELAKSPMRGVMRSLEQKSSSSGGDSDNNKKQLGKGEIERPHRIKRFGSGSMRPKRITADADADSSNIKTKKQQRRPIIPSKNGRAPLKRSNTWDYRRSHKDDHDDNNKPPTRKSSAGGAKDKDKEGKKASTKAKTKSKAKRPLLRRSSSDSGQYFRGKSDMLLLPSEKKISSNNIKKKMSQQKKSETKDHSTAPSATSTTPSARASATQKGTRHKSLSRNLPRSNSARHLMPNSKKTKREALRRSHSGHFNRKTTLPEKVDLSPMPALRMPRRKESLSDAIKKVDNIKKADDQIPPTAQIPGTVAAIAEPEAEERKQSTSSADAGEKHQTQSSLDEAESAQETTGQVPGESKGGHPHPLDHQPKVHEPEIQKDEHERTAGGSSKGLSLRYTPPEPTALLPDLDLPDDLEIESGECINEVAATSWEFSVPQPPELLPEPALSDHRPMVEGNDFEPAIAANKATPSMPEPPGLLPEPDFPEDDSTMLDDDDLMVRTSWNFSMPEPPNLLHEPTLSDHELPIEEEAMDREKISNVPAKRASLTYSMPEPPELLPDPTFSDEEEEDLIADEAIAASWDFSAPEPPSLLPEPGLPDDEAGGPTNDIDAAVLEEQTPVWDLSMLEPPKMLDELDLPPGEDNTTPETEMIKGSDDSTEPKPKVALTWNFSAPEPPQLLPDPTFSDEDDFVDDDSAMYALEDMNQWSFTAPETPKLLPEPTLPSDDDAEYDDDEQHHPQRRYSDWDVMAAARVSDSDSDSDNDNDSDDDSGDSSETSEKDGHDADGDVLMDLRRDKFGQRRSSMNDLMIRQYKLDSMKADDESTEPSDASEQQNVRRESVHMDDLKHGSLYMDESAQHTSHSENSMDVGGAHYSMSVLENEDYLGDLPSFNKNRRAAPKPSFHSSCSALDFVQFTPSNFVQQSQDCFDDHYELGQLLGEGEFGEVYIGYQKQGGELGEERAIKIIDKNKMSSGDYEQVINEFNLLKGLTHPNLLTLYAFYEDDRSCYIVTDICKGGELWDEIDARGNFDEEAAAAFMTHLLSAVSFLQSHKIVHRDINLENILLEENKDLDRMKIIDFGLATKYEDGVKLTDLVGKVHYVAPEVLHQEYEGSKYDVWSCGVVCFILLSGYAPFEGDTDAQVRESVLDGVFMFSEPVWDSISDEAKDFINQLLTYEQDSRPNAEQALKHAWIKNSIKANSTAFMNDYGQSSITCFENMQDFASDASLKLKQAVYTYIASQLLRKTEREEIDRVFRGMDYDCDGKLSRSDIREGYKNFFNKELSTRDTDKMFQRINTSETGFIDYTEFVIAAMQKSKILDAEKLRAAFNSFDRGDKGYISANDLKLALAGVVAVPVNDQDNVKADELIDEMIQQVDVEGDGKISYDNFVAMMMQTGSREDYSSAKTMGITASVSKEEKKGESMTDLSSTSGDSRRTKGERRLDYDWATSSFIGHDSQEWASVHSKKAPAFKSGVAAVTEDEESSEAASFPDESLRIEHL